MGYYPLNYEINYYGNVYRFNATELAWLCALLQGANKQYNALDTYNADLQSLVLKGLVDDNGLLTRTGILVAGYVFSVHPHIRENPLFSLTYDYIYNTDTLDITNKTKYESFSEPRYNFQKRIKKFFDKKSLFVNENFRIRPHEVVVDMDEALPVTNEKPFPDVIKVEKSKALTGIAYNDDTEEMDVHFPNGAIYRYSDVPSIVFTAFRTAQTKLDTEYYGKTKDGKSTKPGSIGSYYALEIKPNYKKVRRIA